MAAALTGCAGFFPPLNTTTTTTTGTGNYVFALAPTNGTLTAYTIGSSALTIGTNSPITLPSGLTSASVGAITVSRNNAYLYVGGIDYIYCYSIGTSGALSLVSTSSVPITANIVSMDTSTDGNFLFALDNTSGSKTVYQFALNASTGAIETVTPVTYQIGSAASWTPKTIHVGASGLVAAALESGGEVFFKYNSSSGISYFGQSNPVAPTEADNDITLNAAGTYAYVARSGTTDGTTPANQVIPLSIGSTTITGGTPTTTGYSPQAILLDSSGDYLYTANSGDASSNPAVASTVNEFSVSSGTVAALKTSSFVPGITATSLARDSTGTYVFAAGIGSASTLQMYTLSSGILASVSGASENPADDAAGLKLATTH